MLYRLTFSDGPIVMEQPYSFSNINQWLTIELVSYTQPDDFTSNMVYNPSFQSVDIELEIQKSLASSTLKTKISDKSKIRTENGKTLKHDEASIKFDGYSKISSGLQSSLNAIKGIAGVAGGTVVAGGVGALTLSSLMGNSLGFLTKMIQIIEFTALMQLFNVEYDRTLKQLLSSVAMLTDIQILSFPTEPILEEQVENSIAGQYKGKLSKVGIPPWILQEIGYLGILLTAIYLIQIPFFYYGKNTKAHRIIQTIRIQLFLAFIVDYIGLTLRTITYGSTNSKDSSLKILSFCLAIFFLICFTIEIVFTYYQTNTLHLLKAGQMTTF